MQKKNSVLPTILKSYGRAAETFPASDTGWHGFFVETPYGPRFLHPKELAVAQRFPWGFALPSCHMYPSVAAHRELDPAPHGLPGSARAGRNPSRLGAISGRRKLGGRWLPQVLRSERWGLGNPAWGPGTGPKSTEPQEIKVPPRPQARAQRAEGIPGMSPPRWRTPHVQGRRAGEGESHYNLD